jgi:hypothetical protein
MLKQNRFSKKIKIDPTFPVDKLIEIFIPYMELYYTQIYSFDLNAKTIAKNQLYWKLKDFYKFNPTFGRKFFVSKNTEEVVYVNEHHMKFEKPNYNKNYRDSHIVLYDNDNDIDSDDDDSDTDSDNDVTSIEHDRPHNIHAFRV